MHMRFHPGQRQYWGFTLLPQQLWRKVNLICGNLPDPKLLQNLLSVEGAEHLAGRLVAELLPHVGIDMAHQKINVLLGEAVEAHPLGKHSANHLVRNLAAAFLVGTLRVAIKDFRSHGSLRVVFDGGGIRELAPPVCQKDGKQLTEHLPPKDLVHVVKTTRDRPGVVSFPKEREHERTVREIDGQEDTASLASFDGIHFHGIDVRNGLQISQVILIGASLVALLIHAHSPFLFAYPVADFSRKINVADGKEPCVNVVVNGLLVQHDRVRVGGADMMDGLSLPHQGRDDAVEACNLLAGNGKTLAAFAELRFVFSLRLLGRIQLPLQAARASLLASEADVRRLAQPSADLFLVVRTMCVAALAPIAGVSPSVGTRFADVSIVAAFLPVKAGVVSVFPFTDKDVCTHFFGNGGRILAEFGSDAFETATFFYASFDAYAVAQCKVFPIGHDRRLLCVAAVRGMAGIL